jgi:ribosomal protein S12 methylthiotransferase
MRRPLGEKNTRALIETMRTIAPDIALRTTFIVGFPGETEADILALRDFVREGHFTHVGVFPYSQESESVAYHFEGQIDDEVKEERRALVMEAQQEVLRERFADVVGSKMRVLIDGTHEESDLLLVGRTEWQGPETDGVVIINDVAEELRAEDESTLHLSGRFATVEITEVAGYDLVGTVIAAE